MDETVQVPAHHAFRPGFRARVVRVNDEDKVVFTGVSSPVEDGTQALDVAAQVEFVRKT